MRAGAVQVAFRWAVLLGALGAGVGAVLLTTAIGRSTISTAALGFLGLPTVMVLWAVPCATMGFCAGYLVAARRLGRPVTSFPMRLAALGLLAVAVPSTASVLTNLATGREVGRVAAMSEGELQRELASKCFGANPFVLAAVALNPRANASALRQIATREDPGLQQKLGSIFDVMGSNRHGLAVMRLVARHPNVDAETLEILAHSDNAYVLSDVALNPKLSEPAMRRLEQQSNPLLDWALARNPRTAPSVLARLSRSSNESVRANVAANPSAPADVWETLRHDPVPRVAAAVPTRCAGGYVFRDNSAPDGGVQRHLECAPSP
jgi:hypothetical protein